MRSFVRFFKLMGRAIECSQLSRAENHIANSGILREVHKRQLEMMTKDL
jgi:hypothetical protein